MGCGLPVIVGDVPAIRDVVSHAHTGWIVPPNSPGALANAIVHLLGHPKLAAELSIAGRQHVIAHFDWSHVAQRYAEILRAMINSADAPLPPADN